MFLNFRILCFWPLISWVFHFQFLEHFEFCSFDVLTFAFWVFDFEIWEILSFVPLMFWHFEFFRFRIFGYLSFWILILKFSKFWFWTHLQFHANRNGLHANGPDSKEFKWNRKLDTTISTDSWNDSHRSVSIAVPYSTNRRK